MLAAPAEEIDEDEATALSRRLFGESDATVALFWLEALVGPDAVWKGVLAELEAKGEALLKNDSAAFGRTVYDLGYLFYRLPAAASEAARRKLRVESCKAFTTPSPRLARSRSNSLPRCAIDVALNGAKGSDRSGHRFGKGVLSPYFLGHVIDDPAYVDRAIPKGYKPFADDLPDPRRAFRGGEPVLTKEVEVWKSYKPHALFVSRFRDIRSPLTVRLMLEMSSTSRAKKDAAAWFVAHAELATQHLAATAKGKGDSAALAKDMLAKLKG